MEDFTNLELQRIFDVDWILKDPVELTKKFAAKGVKVNCAEIAAKYRMLKVLKTERDTLRNQQISVSKTIKKAEKREKVLEECTKLAKEIKDKEKEINTLTAELRAILLTLPNPPADDVVAGGKENNVV